MGIYRFEWKQIRRSCFLWTITLGVLIVVFTLMFADTVANEMQNLKDLLSSNPFYAAMGLDPDTFFSILGLFGYLNSLMAMAGAVQAANLGMYSISKEYMYNTADFLMTKPYTRTSIFARKVLAALTDLGITSAFYIGCSIAAIRMADSESFDSKATILMCLTFPMIQLLFFALGLLIAAIKNRIPNVLPVSLALAFVTYCLGMSAEVMESDVLRAFSPFKYFSTTEILMHHSYETGYLLLWAVASGIFFVAAWRIFATHDIKSL